MPYRDIPTLMPGVITPSRLPSFVINPGMRVHFVGDSITSQGWASVSGGIIDQINALIGSGTHITATSFGTPGIAAAGIAADVTTQITSFNPQCVVLEVGINDVVASTGIPAFVNSYDSIMAQTKAAIPGCQFLCLSCLSSDESWAAGPAWPATGFNPAILTYDGWIQYCANTRLAPYVDLRTPLLAYEVANNTPGPPGASSGILTTDGTHPNATGQVQMGTWCMPYVTVSA